MSESRESNAVYYIVFVVLIALLALTVEVARHDWGRWNFGIATLIAAVKATVIAIYFMQVRRSAAITKMMVCAGVFWLAILFTLTLADFWSRDWLRILTG